MIKNVFYTGCSLNIVFFLSMILIHPAILKIYLKNDITIYKYVHFEQIFFTEY